MQKEKNAKFDAQIFQLLFATLKKVTEKVEKRVNLSTIRATGKWSRRHKKITLASCSKTDTFYTSLRI